MWVYFYKEDGSIVAMMDSKSAVCNAVPNTTITTIDKKVDICRHKIVNGELSETPKPDIDYYMLIRSERDSLLGKTDWTQMPDSPLSAEQKQAWATYRQALRDFPDTCTDLANPIWPTPPY